MDSCVGSGGPDGLDVVVPVVVESPGACKKKITRVLLSTKKVVNRKTTNSI